MHTENKVSKPKHERAGQAAGQAECHCSGDSSDSANRAAPKWAANINDAPVPSPRQKVKVQVLKDNANIPADEVLVRDHNSLDDVYLDDDTVIDLAEGNTFYTVTQCQARPKKQCSSPARMSYFVDDCIEVTLNANFTGAMVRGLFNLDSGIDLFRDLESPNDVPIRAKDSAAFADGPVFYTRAAKGLFIVVNKKKFTETDGVKPQMTGRELAKLVIEKPKNPTITLIGENRKIGLDETVEITCGMEFEIIRDDVKGGYNKPRIEMEIDILRQNGAAVDFVEGPRPAIIYRGMKTRHLAKLVDVLVPVPSGYPGHYIDLAFLPSNSNLFGKVPGARQGHAIVVDGVRFEQVSYHPHNGGGGPAWNSNRHGFHTYYDEVLAWLN
ncbi:MAG: hypothetical protein Q7Q73_15625 [Verrucomicrobiota bacterium JB024]|nr:hypothetical protein [Verrucomicrobiota bacterium JB024]